MLKLLITCKFLYYQLKFHIVVFLNNFKHGKPQLNYIDPEYKIKIKKNGYVIIKNYYDRRQCDQIKQFLEKNFQSNKINIWKGSDLNSDKRIFGAERLENSCIKKFNFDQKLLKIGNDFMNQNLVNSYTMAGKINYVKNNLGSGEGWHRDSIQPCYKALLYLTDVDKNFGPLQIIEKTNKFYNVVKDHSILKKHNLLQTRYDNDQIKKLIEVNLYKITSIEANAGTVILFDGSNLHRGAPINKGVRFALTNYYFTEKQSIKEKEKVKHFLN